MKSFCYKENYTKYWKYVYNDWTQPILTSNTSYGTITCSGYYGGHGDGERYPWHISDGQWGSQSVNIEWGTDNSNVGWVNWKLPVTLKILGITIHNRVHPTNLDYTLTGARLYTNDSRTTPIGEEFSFTSSGGSHTLTTIPSSGIITDNIYFYKTGSTYSGVGEIVITAQERQVVESTSSDYDYTTQETRYKLHTQDGKYSVIKE